MKLKEKTRRKFVDFFDKMAQMHQGKEFELAYSDIQRETGTASVTLRRAVQALQEEGILAINPGHNSRYARFAYLPAVSGENGDTVQIVDFPGSNSTVNGDSELQSDMNEVQGSIESLRQRMRAQEMCIASLQERLAELEEKLSKRYLPAVARDFSVNK